VAQRIERGSAINRSALDLEFQQQGRLRRLGRLPVPPGSNGREVRCECRRCGAHLLVMPGEGGRLSGTCVVCGASAVTPVG
jgi:hypothetical protein